MLTLKGFQIDRTRILGKSQYKVYPAKKDGKEYAAKYLHDRTLEEIMKNELFLYHLGRVHPNILEVENYCQSDDEFGSWIFTELCTFGNLATYSKDHADDFRKNETKHTIMKQLTAGVKFLHDQDKVHRDIKPGNILITKQSKNNNDGIWVKLSDFGESRSLHQTMTATAIGTPWFAAPEIFDHEQNDSDSDETEGATPQKLQSRQSNKVDIFSLGLTLLGMLQHRKMLLPLGDGLRQNEFIGNIILQRPNYQPFRISSNDDSFTKAVKEIILKTLIYDPHKRPTATGILQALEDIHIGPQVRLLKILLTCHNIELTLIDLSIAIHDPVYCLQSENLH